MEFGPKSDSRLHLNSSLHSRPGLGVIFSAIIILFGSDIDSESEFVHDSGCRSQDKFQTRSENGSESDFISAFCSDAEHDLFCRNTDCGIEFELDSDCDSEFEFDSAFSSGSDSELELDADIDFDVEFHFNSGFGGGFENAIVNGI